MYQLIYSPVVIMIITSSMYFSCRLNQDPDNYKWFLLSWLFTSIPIWTFIAKYSSNIVLDAALFDILVFLSSIFVSVYMTKKMSDISITEVLGIMIMFVGLLIYKIGEH